MRGIMIVVLAVSSGCAAQIAPSDEAADGGDAPSYVRTASTEIAITGPGSVAMLGVACNEGDVVTHPACSAGEGATLVQSAGTDYSWSCAFASTKDAVRVGVEVTCMRNEAPLCCFQTTDQAGCSPGGWLRQENATASSWAIGEACQSHDGCGGIVTVCPDP